jgi:ribosomal protein S12 methylthiotransferase accessory factor
MNRPAWKSHLRLELLAPDGVVLLAENGHYVFSGDAYARLAPRLDGRRTEDEVLVELEREGVPLLSARLALSHFEALGLLDEADSGVAPRWGRAERAYWHGLGHGVEAVADRLARSSIAIRSVGGSHTPALAQALEAARVRIDGGDGNEELLVVLADDYLDPRLGEVDRARRRQRKPWALVKLVGSVVWVGPLFVPGRTGCWACLAHRLGLNRQTEQIVREQTGLGRPPEPSSSWSARLGAAVAAAELALWLGTGRHDGLEGTVLTLDLKDNATVRHSLTRRPQCLECGDGPAVGASEGRPVCLGRAPKVGPVDGRGESPDAILERLGHHVSPITGVVRSLTDLTDDGLVLASASQTFPMDCYDFRILRANLLGRSGGKGTDRVRARAGALCEALERYCGSWQPEDRARTATRTELGKEAIDLAECLGFSPAQYAERDARNAANDDPQAWIPRPLEPWQNVGWVPFWSLTGERIRLLPAAFAYYGHPELRLGFCVADSNGCAAGATPAEAVAHGLLEVIERDAVGIWWSNRVRRPAVPLGSADQPVVRDAIGRHRALGREVWALDLTTDVGIPVVAVVSARTDHPVEDIVFGFGADLDPFLALLKAVMEMDQTHFWVSRRGPDGSTQYRTDRPPALRWFRSATRANQPYLVPDPGAPACRLAAPAATDWREDVTACVDRLRVLGLEVLVLDQSRPDVGFPVFRVVVPGLCHFWSRHGARRLYEVPVALGWRDRPCREEDLNPWCIFF